MYIYQNINMSKKILVVEDEIELLDFYDKMLTAEDYTVYKSETGKKAIDIFDKEDPKIIIMDIKLPDISGIEVTRYIKEKSPDAIIIAVSAYGEKLKEAVNAGAYTLVQKPFLQKELISLIKNLTQSSETIKDEAIDVSFTKKRVPSSLTRVAFDAVITNMGEGSLRILLKKTNLDRYIGNLPPHDDSPSITVDEYIILIQTIFDIFGQKGAKAILYICGKEGFKNSLKHNPALFGVAGVALKFMSNEKKKKFILEKVLKKLEEIFGNVHILEEDQSYFYIKLPECPYCKGQKSDSPICYTPIGFYEEVIKWATGKSEKVEQIQCIAMGHENCVFKISK